MIFTRDDDQGVFAIAQHSAGTYAAVQQVGAYVVLRTVEPNNLGVWFDQNADLDALVAFGQAIIDAANASKKVRM